MQPVSIDAYTLTSATGTGITALREVLKANHSGLTHEPWPRCDIDTWVGRVGDLDDVPPLAPERDSRNNRLACLGLEQDGFSDCVRQAIRQFGAWRVAVVLGTSTSSIGRTERGYRALDDAGRFPPELRQPLVHNPHSPGDYVAHHLGASGPALTISTACSSSAKAFACATRMLEQDIADAVVVGGVDSLCLSVLYGFHSLQLIAPDRCRPFDRARAGINIGEAAAFALLTRPADQGSGVALVGYGESSDAHHMSSAHPEGLGARIAIDAALDRAGCDTLGIDYLNLHGTGTRANDEIEGKVCTQLFGPRTRASATKGVTGHTLGAAGASEAVICIDAIATGNLPGTVNTREPEPGISRHLLLDPLAVPIRTAMSNSFGFGGNNCTLVFARA